MLNSRLRWLTTVVAAFLLLIFAMADNAAASAQDVKVAVLPFTINAGGDLDYLQDSLPELIGDRLADAEFQVVSQDDVKAALAQRNITEINADNARELAQAVGAGFAIYGSLNQIGETLSIDARLIEAGTNNPGKKISVSEEGLINLLPAVDQLVSRMKMDLLRLDVIESVDVEGTQVLDKEVVLMRLTLQKGDLLTAKGINDALKNIYDLGYFDDVKVQVATEPEGKRVVFVVKEKPRIQAVDITGSDEIDSDDILEAISTKKGGVVNLKVLADDIRVIREMYRKDGYYNVKVTHEIADAGNGTARLTFVIDEGEKLYIENVIIDGAKQLDPDDIKDELALKERGFFSWITDSGVLKEELLDRDAAAIQAYYQSRGFLKVKVGRPEVKIKEKGIDIVYPVWEGDRYKMGATTFKGDLIDSKETLLSVVKIDSLKEKDEYFDRSMIQGDIKSLTNHYNDYGYAYVDVQVKLNDHSDTLIVDVEYVISKHQRVHIRRVLVEGNTSTRDNVILREMRLADGDMFHGGKLLRSYQRLNNLDYFEKIDITPVPTGNPEEMDLLVKVKDKPTGNVGGGIGYSTYENVYVAGNITEKNLFGRGYSLSLNASFSSVKTSYVLDFINPHINDTDIGFGLEAYHKTEDFNYYDKTSTGSSIKFFKPVGEYSKISWAYTLSQYTLDNVDDDASDRVKDQEGDHLLSQLSASFTRDTRDDARMTTTGTLGTVGIQYGGGVLGGTDDFVKYTATYNWWTPAFEKVIFHSKFWGGYVHNNFGGDEIPTDQRFELGGIYNIRGYSMYSISPLDSDGKEIGGNKAFYTNLELTRLLSKEYGITGLTFLDAGNSWKEDESIFSSPTRKGYKPSLGLYKGVGVGMNWYSPMGPIGIVYGYGLDQIEGESRQKFEFQMGRTF